MSNELWTVEELYSELTKAMRNKESCIESILTAVNSHNELLEACKKSVGWLKTNEGDAEGLLYKLESAIKKATK